MSEKDPLMADPQPAAPPPQYSEVPPTQYSDVPPTAPPPATTVYTQPVTVVQQIQLGEFPVTMNCPTGGHQITTQIRYTSGTLTWIIAAVLCFFLGPCCALIPFCIDSMKDVEHVCPIDGTVIGVYRRFG